LLRVKLCFRDRLSHDGIGGIFFARFDDHILKHHHLRFEGNVDDYKIILHINLSCDRFIAQVLKNDIVAAWS